MMAPNVAAGVHLEAPTTEIVSAHPLALWGREFVAKKGGGALPTSTTAEQLVAMVRAKVDPWIKVGGGCLVSIKLDPREMAKGLWTPHLTALAKALVDLDVIVVLWHEQEDDWTATVFKPGFEAGRQALKVGDPNIVVALCSMAYQWRPGSRTTATRDALIWASIEADLYLVDVYSGKTFPPGQTLPEHPGWIRWYALMISPYADRRWGVAERGWLASTVRAATIRREAAWLATDPIGRTCRIYVVWGTGGTEKNPGWLLDDDALAAVNFLLDAIAQPAQPAQPASYEPGPVAGTLVHLPTGVLVADHLAEAHTAWLARIGEQA